MEEVRSYWQVAGIAHFCNLFGKPFKLPNFEPEELEQAFIIEVPEPKQQQQQLQQAADEQQQQQPPQQEQQDLHLLVRLGIALLKPHFNCKISLENWENYLRRIIDANWVELEHHPSPFQIPIITSDGIELTKNLTFNELTLSDKIDVFYALCDYRFWCEDASEAITDYPLEELRLESIGKDSQGYEYWYFFGARLFREDKELSQDLILRKKRIKELEFTLIELEKAQILREQEIKRKAELEKAKQQAAEEARLAAANKKRQQEQDNSNKNKRRKDDTPTMPLRSGLRERRSSAASNSNDSQQQIRTPTTRSKLAKQQPVAEEQPIQSSQKTTRSSSAAKGFRQGQRNTKTSTPEPPKKCPILECKEELERIAIKPEDRAASWCIHCESLEDWESFATKFDKTKSINEKYLQSYVNQEILPKIRALYAKQAAEARRKEKELLFSLASRRVSTRIISKRAQEEEDERRAQQREAEIQKKKAEAELRLRAELEREIRAKQSRFVINGGTSSNCSDDGANGTGGTHAEEDIGVRYNLRQQHYDAYGESNEFDGIIHPDKLSEFYEALELIIDTVKTSKHAWPFVDPVPDTVPGYYDLIQEPMDIKKLRTKVEFREYRSLIEVEKDFQLLVNNCEKFNGPKNVYTKMVYRLWNTFRKNVRLYLQRDLHMDEFETFIYPPPLPVVQTSNHDSNHSTIPNGVNHVENDKQEQDQFETVSKVEADCRAEDGQPIHTNGIHVEPKPEINSNSTSNSDVQTNCLIKTELGNFKMEPVAGLQPLLQAPPPTLAPNPIVGDEVSMESIIVEQVEPPEVICEEVVIDSYAVPCPDEKYFIWPQDVQPTAQEQNQ